MAVPVAVNEKSRSPIGKQGSPWGVISNLTNGFPPDCRKE